MRIVVRLTAIFGVVAIMSGGVISAIRHEEIYIICPIAWCIGAAQVIQAFGLGSWGLGVFLVAFCLLFALYGLLVAITASFLLVLAPRSRLLLQLGSMAYITFAFAVWSPLYLIFTDDRLRSLFKSASGPPLSEWYSILPALFFVTGLSLYTFSKMLGDNSSDLAEWIG